MALLEKTQEILREPLQVQKHLLKFQMRNSTPVSLNCIECIEKSCKKKAIKNLLPHQSGDVTTTLANMEKLNSAVNFSIN